MTQCGIFGSNSCGHGPQGVCLGKHL